MKSGEMIYVYLGVGTVSTWAVLGGLKEWPLAAVLMACAGALGVAVVARSVVAGRGNGP